MPIDEFISILILMRLIIRSRGNCDCVMDMEGPTLAAIIAAWEVQPRIGG